MNEEMEVLIDALALMNDKKSLADIVQYKSTVTKYYHSHYRLIIQ